MVQRLGRFAERALDDDVQGRNPDGLGRRLPNSALHLAIALFVRDNLEDQARQFSGLADRRRPELLRERLTIQCDLTTSARLSPCPVSLTAVAHV